MDVLFNAYDLEPCFALKTRIKRKKELLRMITGAVTGACLERLHTNTGVDSLSQLDKHHSHMTHHLYFLLPEVRSVVLDPFHDRHAEAR